MRHPHPLLRHWFITLSQFQGALPDVLPSPPAPCLASVATVRCRCKTALGLCLPPLSHTLALHSKIILTPPFHVFAPDLVSASDIIPEHCRADFIEQVFWNIQDVIAVNTRLRDALNKRQKLYAVIKCITDIFRDNVPLFAPFVSYGAHQLYGKYEFEKEKSSSLAFAQFVEVRTHLLTDHPQFDITV